MTHTIYDANGNVVGGTSAFCTRCGAHIKHVYTYNGKPYGSECIEAVTGVSKEHQIFKNGELDIDASESHKAQAEANRADHIRRNQELEANREATRQENRRQFAEIINLLKNMSNRPGDFCDSVADQIANDGSTTKLCEILSTTQYTIVRDIWGKDAGRYGSKKYNKAVEEFDSKFDN